MNRIDRLTAILIHLQSQKIVRAEEMANRFEISIRTVYRDVKALMEAGVPIGSEAGTGYFIRSLMEEMVGELHIHYSKQHELS